MSSSASGFGVSGSASAAYEEESSHATKNTKQRSVQKLEIAYKVSQIQLNEVFSGSDYPSSFHER